MTPHIRVIIVVVKGQPLKEFFNSATVIFYQHLIPDFKYLFVDLLQTQIDSATFR